VDYRSYCQLRNRSPESAFTKFHLFTVAKSISTDEPMFTSCTAGQSRFAANAPH
jgi:hypothetical protein